MAKIELFVGILVQPHYFDVFNNLVFFVLIIPHNNKLIWFYKVKIEKKKLTIQSIALCVWVYKAWGYNKNFSPFSVLFNINIVDLYFFYGK
jgi:hypothetical protein